MSKIKPILFNTEMVRAILEDRKTVTRRVVKLKYSNTHLEMRTDKYGTRLIELQNEEPGVTTVRNPDGTTTHKLLAAIERTPPYRPGDILYVRETWARIDGDYVFKADDEVPEGWYLTAWLPSIHMPREAARIFLRVTDVRVEMLQECGKGWCLDIEKEGILTPQDPILYINDDTFHEALREEFQKVWDSTIKPADRALYGWEANPFVWVIEFERCEKPKEGPA